MFMAMYDRQFMPLMFAGFLKYPEYILAIKALDSDTNKPVTQKIQSSLMDMYASTPAVVVWSCIEVHGPYDITAIFRTTNPQSWMCRHSKRGSQIFFYLVEH